jgi:hypothetical protein
MNNMLVPSNASLLILKAKVNLNLDVEREREPLCLSNGVTYEPH